MENQTTNNQSKKVDNNPMPDNGYKASDITVLEGLEAVRHRPGMYIGNTSSKGLHHLVWELIDNSVDEALAGHCDHITVTLSLDHWIRVEDNGRGIPVDIHPQYNKSAAEVVLTVLHAGGKFDNSNYKVSGGLHGVGISVVNALSSQLFLEIHKNGNRYFQEYRVGDPVTELEVKEKSDKTGTAVSFLADADIFENIEYDANILSARFRELAFLNKGLKIDFITHDSKEQFHYPDGIKDYIPYLNLSNKPLHEEVLYFDKEITKDDKEYELEVALQWNESYKDKVLSFANNINTHEGGSHLQGFIKSLVRVINKKAKALELLKEDEVLTKEDIKEGLNAVVSIKLPNPQFEGQTKAKLGNTGIEAIVSQLNTQFLEEYFEENPQETLIIINKNLNALKARQAALKAREVTRKKITNDVINLPGKLADCSSKDPLKCELFCVEGDSAGGCVLFSDKVKLASGKSMTFEELAQDWDNGISHFGYATDENGNIIVVPLIEPRLTKKEADLVEVKLDNEETIKCTPCHKFRLRDGSYKRADELKENDSLMPIKIKFSSKKNKGELNGYEMVWHNGSKSWEYTHRLSDQYNLNNNLDDNDNRKSIRHHRDFNKLNNDPRNIQRMTWQEHYKLHSEYISILWQDPQFIKMMSESTKKQWKDPSHKEYISNLAKKQWQDPEYREFKRQSAIKQHQEEGYTEALTASFLDWYNNLDDSAKQEYVNNMKNIQFEYWSVEENRIKQSERVTQYFIDNPDHREKHGEMAIDQWNDEELRAWRSEETKKQWLDDSYRENHSNTVKDWWKENPGHKLKLEKGKKNKALNLINKIILEINKFNIEVLENEYQKELNLIANQDNKRHSGIMNFSTLLNKYYDNDLEKLLEEARNYNCKVVSVTHLEETGDVYDLTIDKYHNFALDAGIFVHNSSKQARNRETQAILPLRGKVINAEKHRADKVLENNEVQSLITAVGTNYGEDFDIEKLRYHKIILACDADIDGAHITTLLLTFFHNFLPEIIEGGYLYIAQPPLYKVKIGKNEHYVLDDDELDNLLMSNNKLTIYSNYVEGQKDNFINLDFNIWKKFNKLLKEYTNLIDKFRANNNSEFVYKLVKSKIISQLNDPNINKNFLDDYVNPYFKVHEYKLDVENSILELSLVDVVNETTYKDVFYYSDLTYELDYFAKLEQQLADLVGYSYHYVMSDNDQLLALDYLELKTVVNKLLQNGVKLSRFKGLGEMNPDQLYDTTMDPENRRLVRVTIDDASMADMMFTILMGEEVKPRREFIEKYAKTADLDL